MSAAAGCRADVFIARLIRAAAYDADISAPLLLPAPAASVIDDSFRLAAPRLDIFAFFSADGLFSFLRHY
jgi:hypothetical protein